MLLYSAVAGKKPTLARVKAKGDAGGSQWRQGDAGADTDDGEDAP